MYSVSCVVSVSAVTALRQDSWGLSVKSLCHRACLIHVSTVHSVRRMVLTTLANVGQVLFIKVYCFYTIFAFMNLTSGTFIWLGIGLLVIIL